MKSDVSAVLMALIICTLAGVGCYWAGRADAPKPEPQAAISAYEDGTTLPIFLRGSRWNVVFGGAYQNGLLDGQSAYATTHCENRTINVRGSLTTANQRDTVLHELLHASTCDEAGGMHNDYYNSDFISHIGIYKIADFTSTLLHENPELTRFRAGN